MPSTCHKAGYTQHLGRWYSPKEVKMGFTGHGDECVMAKMRAKAAATRAKNKR